MLKEIDAQYLVHDYNKVDASKHTEEQAVTHQEDIPSKATILSRMAKMGKPLPQLAASTTSEISDSSDQDEVKAVPIAHPRRTMNKIVPVKNCIPTADYHHHHPQTSMDHSLVAYNLDATSSGLNILLADNRSQNTEIRMNLSKLETKIEKVLEKIDLIEIGGRTTATQSPLSIDKEAVELELERKILELKKENRQLRIKVKQLTEQCSMTVTMRNNHLEANEDKIQLLENEIKQLHAKELEYIDLIKINENLKLENDRRHILIQQKCDEINLLNEKQQFANGSQQNKFEELKKNYENCANERNSLKNDKELQEKKINEMQEQLDKLKIEIFELKQEKSNENTIDNQSSIDGIVKMVMNSLYQKLHDIFSEQEMFTQKEILKITGTTIKNETLAALKK